MLVTLGYVTVILYELYVSDNFEKLNYVLAIIEFIHYLMFFKSGQLNINVFMAHLNILKLLWKFF